MNKLMVFLGLLLSAVLFYFCLNFSGGKRSFVSSNSSAVSKEIKKSNLEVKENQNKKIASKETLIQKPVVKKEPLLDYKDKDGVLYISALLSKKDKNASILSQIDKLCQNVECKKDIKFLDDRKNASWNGYAVRIIGFFKDKGVKDAKLFIEGKKVVVEGVLPDEKAKEDFSNLLDSLLKNGFSIDDKTSVKENIAVKESLSEAEENIKPEENIKKAKEEIKNTQEEIANLLSMEPIRFKLNRFKITKDSEKTLQKAIKLLDTLPSDVQIEVAGYTDARGDKNYNLILSQKRAKAVMDYLKSHMKSKKVMVAKGYGATNFIAGDPKDIKNRRVEIHLSKGE